MKTIEAKGEYIFVEYDEPYLKSVLIEMMRETHQKSKELGCYKLLGDISKMRGSVGTMDRFEMGVRGADLFRGGYKIALVYQPEEINRFAETVSVNRGLNARIFGDKKDALEWLLTKD